MSQIGKFRTIKYNNFDGLMFYCPGCSSAHTVTINGVGTWIFNNDYNVPTINPSVLTRGGTEDIICHLFLKNGMLEFLNDCTHDLKGQTVPLPELPDWLKD